MIKNINNNNNKNKYQQETDWKANNGCNGLKNK